MRKFRSLLMVFAIVVCTLTAYAKTTKVEPGSGLRSAMTGAANGDVLVLSTGEYTVSSNIDLSTAGVTLTVQAEDGATPVIVISGGAAIRVRKSNITLNLVGLVLDAKETTGFSQYAIKPYPSGDASGMVINLTNCTFQNMRRAIYSYAAMKDGAFHIKSCTFRNMERAFYSLTYLDPSEKESYDATRAANPTYQYQELTIDDCQFYNMQRALSIGGARMFAKTISITNSTFAHVGDGKNRTIYFSAISGEDEAFYPVDFTLDHCTFYDCNNTRTVYCPAFNGSKVTNCLLENTATTVTDEDGVMQDCYSYAVYGDKSYVKNSISYKAIVKNSSGATVDKVSYMNPYLVDGEHDNFQLCKNSPAIGAATNGSNLGDPRWGVSSQEADPSLQPYAERIMKTPYSMSPTTSSVKILWQVADNLPTGVVKYGLSKDNLNMTASSTEGIYVEGEGFVHVVTLTGLQSFKRYYYQVGDGKSWLDQVNSTKTAPESGIAYRIFTISDIHVNSRSNWSNMQDFICNLDCDFMMCNGDFVNNGAGRDWNPAYFTPGKPFLSQTPMMSSAGNHETGDPDTYRYSTFYDYFWQFSHGYTDGDNIKDPRGESYFAFDYGNARILAVNVNGDHSSPEYKKGSKQYEWLKNELANTDKPWILIFGHVGLTSSGYHGQWPPEYRNDWRTLFEQAVAAGKHIIYFCGDDHSFEHAYKDGVHYVRPGCGRNSNYAQVQTPDLKYNIFYKQISCYSTLDMSADASNIHLTARDSAGNVFYEYDFKQAGDIILPTLRIMSPATDTELADSTMITWVAGQAAQDAKVSLYYTTVKGATTGGTPFATNLPAEQGRAMFNGRPIMPKGDYYIYGVMTSGDKEVTATAAGKLTLLADTEAPDAPTDLDGNSVNGRYILTWKNPTTPVNTDIALWNTADATFGYVAGEADGGSMKLSKDNDALTMEYNITAAWGEGSAVWYTPAPTNYGETHTLQFSLKGDGSTNMLRLIVKNDDYGHLDWWFDESVSLSSTQWKDYSIDLKRMTPQDWMPNTGKNDLGRVMAVLFTIPSEKISSGTVQIKNVRLNGMVNPCPDYAYTVIRRSESAYPTSVTDGDEVYRGPQQACKDQTGDVSKTYYYSAFAVDDMGNVSTTAAQWCSTNLNPSITESVLSDLHTVMTSDKPIKFIRHGHCYIQTNKHTFTLLGESIK